MTTQIKSEKRSKSLLERKTELQYSEDFWTFYLNNTSFVEDVFASALSYVQRKYCWLMPRQIEKGDVRAQALCQLYQSDFLKKWNSQKSALSTYLTNHIRWSVNRILYMECKKTNQMHEFLGFQELSSELNGEEESPWMLTDEPDQHQALETKELVERVYGALKNPGLKTVFNQYVREDKSMTEIARNISCSTTSISIKCHEIRNTALSVAQSM